MADEKAAEARHNKNAYVDVTEDPPKTQSTTTTSDTDGIGKETGSPAGSLGTDGHQDNYEKNHKEEVAETRRRSSVVQALAKSYSRASGLDGSSPFFADEESPLNPHSPNFDAKQWATSIVDMVREDGGSFRSSGVCFQHLNVHGYGVATDYQKDVANVWLGLGSMVQQLTGNGGRQKINILQNFDGLVRNGEMLVVLGPPGSGCSTFLKSIAGEMNGIYLGEGSYFNYQGKSLDLNSHGTRGRGTCYLCSGRVMQYCFTVSQCNRPTYVPKLTKLIRYIRKGNALPSSW